MELRNIKVGDFTNAGWVLWVDEVSELVPDPLVRVSSTGKCTHRLSELKLADAPPREQVTFPSEEIEVLFTISKECEDSGKVSQKTLGKVNAILNKHNLK